MVSVTSTSPESLSIQSTGQTRRETPRRWLESLTAGAVINVLIWLVVTQAFTSPLRTQDELALGDYEVRIPLVLITTLVATTVAALGRAAAGRILASPSTPWTVTTTIAGLASLAGPASAAIDNNVQIGLSTMHIATVVVVLIAHLRPRTTT